MIRVTRSSKRLKGEQNHAENQSLNGPAKSAKIIIEDCEKKSTRKIKNIASKVGSGEEKNEYWSLALTNVNEKQKKVPNNLSIGESLAQIKTKVTSSANQILQKLDVDVDPQLNKVEPKALKKYNENKRKFGRDIKNVAGLPQQSEKSAAKNDDFSISSITGFDKFKLTTSTPVVLLKRLERDSKSKAIFNSDQLDPPDFPQFLSPVLSEEQRTMSTKAAGSDKCILNFDQNEGNKVNDGESSKKVVKMKSKALMAQQQKPSKEIVIKIDSQECSNTKKPAKLFSKDDDDDDDDFQRTQSKLKKKTYMKKDNVTENKKTEGIVVQDEKSFKLFDMDVEYSKTQEKVTKKEVVTKKQKEMIKKADKKSKVQGKQFSLKPTGVPPASRRANNKQTKTKVQESDWLPQTEKRMEEINYIAENYSLIIE